MKFDKVIVMVIAYWVCEIAFRLCMYFEWDYFQLTEKDSDNEYLYIIFLSISDLFAIFPILFFCIIRKIEKRRERINRLIMNENLSMSMTNQNDNNDERPNVEVSNPTNRRTIKNLLYLAVIFIFDLLARSNYFAYHSLSDTDNEEVSQKFAHDFLLLVDIIMRFLFYKLSFHMKFKKHHIVSICIISFIFISLIVFDILNLTVTKKYIISQCFIYMAALIPRSLLFPGIDTVCKKIMEKKYIYPLKYMLYRGIGETLYLLILTPILYYNSLFHITLDIFTRNFWIISSTYILTNCVKASLLINLVYYKSSTFVSFLIMSEPIAGSIYGLINNIMYNKTNALSIIFAIIEIISLVLIVFATLIYEGIIKLPCCGLNKDLDDSIHDRAEEDQLLTISPITNDDDEE